ncbi:hypothetical protein [Dyadobacter frigoris]|uniref:Uncharacterized protein n=1 Tax=Dyadobacter frigoris TaxID=2576211 RepID=A0A4U6CY34_9BACT|nr:hypothetical protein [Dyadobacter frigoris]TKT88667.1 hypothetical protein FDK13_25505 [Dyadobacter frigoris]GLU53849.1 hypothetical protein Dfri01_33100 [Dyadobacter frigoris]
MIHEKVFTLKNRREVKVIFKATYLPTTQKLKTDYEILIREPGEKLFREPIGISHPKYWKLQTVSKEQGRELILLYSGISHKQLQSAENEFNQLMLMPA